MQSFVIKEYNSFWSLLNIDKSGSFSDFIDIIIMKSWFFVLFGIRTEVII